MDRAGGRLDWGSGVLSAGRPGRVLRTILTEGLRLVLGGIATGFIAAFTLVKLISSQLSGVSARDPLSLLLVTALLAIICLLAVQRALRVDPAVALRAD